MNEKVNDIKSNRFQSFKRKKSQQYKLIDLGQISLDKAEFGVSGANTTAVSPTRSAK